MRLLAFEAFVVFSLAIHPVIEAPELLPVPEQASAKIGKQEKTSNNKNENSKLPTPTPAPTVEHTDTKNQQEGRSYTDQNGEIQRRLMHYTWWLVVIGYLTAAAICWQSWETRKAANAAKDAVIAQIASLRPYITTAPHGDIFAMLADLRAPRVSMELNNIGNTPAHDLIYESWIELLPSISSEFTAAASYFKCKHRTVLNPHGSPVILNIPIQGGMSDLQRTRIKRLELYVCFRIAVSYRDEFCPQRHANFGYYVESKGLGFLANYNDAN